MPRLLLVCETFPPDAAVGAKRTRRIAHHLSNLGWEVEVLTVTSSGYEHRDPTLLEREARYTVVRTFAVTPMLWGRRLRDRLRRSGTGIPGGPNGRPAGGAEAVGAAAAGSAESSLWERWRGLLTTPDEYVGWIPTAAAGGVMRAARPDLVLASGPPFSSHLAAALIARMRRVPLVLDYRDPWTTRFRTYAATPLGRMERRAENWVLRRAAGVVATTKGICESVGALRTVPARVIPNAYDLDQMRGIEPMTYEKFTLVYMGSFYAGRDPGPIVRALSFLKERGRMPAGGLDLRVLGGTPGDVRRALAGTGIEEHVVFEGLLPYREAMRRVAGADVLLLVVGRNHAEMLPGKLFDYLATGRPVIGIGPIPSEAADLLKASGAGVMLDPDDVPGIASALQAHFLAPRRASAPLVSGGPYEAGRTMRDLDLFLRTFLGTERAGRSGG